MRAITCGWSPAPSATGPALSALAIPNSPTLSEGPSPPTLGRTTGILLAGGLAGLLSWQNEDPDRAVSFMSDVFLGAAIGLAVGDAVIRPGFGEGRLDRIAVGRNGVGLRVQF